MRSGERAELTRLGSVGAGAPGAVGPRGSVPRADVAAVLVSLLDTPGSAGEVLELIGGDVPIDQAVAAAILPNPA